MIMHSDEIKEYLRIGEDKLKEFVGQGLPCLWTGGASGCGQRLFHRGLVDQWIAERTLAQRRAAGGEAPTAAPRQGGRRKAKAAAGGLVKTEAGYEWK